MSLPIKSTLDKTYDPASLTESYHKLWLSGSLYDPPEKGEPYAIVFPPPNVTGTLHMGHALNCTLQDVYSRFKRMSGYRVLWTPGFDHAGIATQMMVEKSLIAEGTSRRELGREEFVKRVWSWKKQYSDRITKQAHALSLGCAWNRLRFTMDDGLSRAVVKSFVKLHEQGLIYRDKRLVNWDIQLQTAVSDLEVIHETRQSKLYSIRYPLVGSKESIVVATIRPETLFGDEAVAVHPDDERYRHLIGQRCLIPLTKNEIPIIADPMVKMDFGSGLVKITPAHDFNDFQVAKRHKLPVISIMDLQGRLNECVPEPWRGMDRLAARQSVIDALKEQSFLEQVDDYSATIPIGDRSGKEIEPILTWQWFVDAKKLAEPVLKLVDEGKTNFHPANWKTSFCGWLNRIEPWCISRQLWWGHRIPAWYAENQAFVAESETEARKLAEAAFGKGVELTQDEDVLDTWFSSALWPYSVLGWPDESPQVKQEVKSFYPAQLIITGHDILFFWVARMMMMGVFTHGQVAFKDVYINAIVKDAHGKKMSKTKGNTIDPMVSVKDHGADALRYALIIQASPGRDIRMDEARVAGMRIFANKIWNAIRFYQLYANNNKFTVNKDYHDGSIWRAPESRWIIQQWNVCLAEVTKDIDAYRPDRATQNLYKFIWSIFCDWYIEFIKHDLQTKEAAPELIAEHLECSRLIIDGFLRALHPFMPVLSEHLWNAVVPEAKKDSDNSDHTILLEQKWPDPIPLEAAALSHDQPQSAIPRAIDLINELRSIRSLFESKASYLSFDLASKNNDQTRWISIYKHKISKMSLVPISPSSESKEGSEIEKVADEMMTIDIENENVICRLSIAKEALEGVCTRLDKRIAELETLFSASEKKLNNPQFKERAPHDVVKEKEDAHKKISVSLQEMKKQKTRLSRAA